MKTWTTMGWLLLLSGGCGRAAVPAAPPPLPNPVPERSAGPMDPHAGWGIRACVLEDGRLREVRITYDVATGDSIFEGRPFRQRFGDTREYAASHRWFVDNEPITFAGRRYTRYGLPRVLGIRELRTAGEYDGVLLFGEADRAGTPDVLYVPVRSGCEFQPYQWDLLTGGGPRRVTTACPPATWCCTATSGRRGARDDAGAAGGGAGVAG